MQHTRFDVVASYVLLPFAAFTASHSQENRKENAALSAHFLTFLRQQQQQTHNSDNFIHLSQTESQLRAKVAHSYSSSYSYLKSVSESQSSASRFPVGQTRRRACRRLAINLETPRSRRPVCIWLSGSNDDDSLRAGRETANSCYQLNQSPTRSLLSLSRTLYLSFSVSRVLEK